MKMFKWLNGKMKSVTVVALAVLIAGGMALSAAEKTVKVERVEKVEKAEKGGKGFLGIQVENLSADESGKPGVQNGVVVRSVQEEGPAARAGIKEKDIIQAVNGGKIGSAEDLVKAVRELEPGTEVKVTLLREGKPLEVAAKLGEARERRRFIWKSSGGPMPFPPFFQQGRYLGITLQELKADLAPYFNVKAGEGVLILDVEKESPAEKAELKAGDVIVEIGGQPMREPAAVSKAVRETKKGEKISLTVLRHGKKMTVTAEPGERHMERRMKRIIRLVPGDRKNLSVVSEADSDMPDAEDMDIDLKEFDVDVELPDLESVRECAKEAMEKAHIEMEKVHADMEKTKLAREHAKEAVEKAHVEMEKARAEMEKNREKIHRELRVIRDDRWI